MRTIIPRNPEDFSAFVSALVKAAKQRRRGGSPKNVKKPGRRAKSRGAKT